MASIANQLRDHVYLWGNLWTGMFLARTRPDAIEDPTSYEYLAAAPTLNNPESRSSLVK